MRSDTSPTREGNRDQSSTQLGASFDLAPAVIASKISDGGSYVLIWQERQSDEPKVFSTGDAEQTFHLLQQTTRLSETQPA